MLFLFGLYEQLNSHFLLWKLNSLHKPSIGMISADENLVGISFMIKTTIRLPCLSWSRQKGEAYQGIWNWLTGKDSSSLVSEITNTTIIHLICSASKSNLFLNELRLSSPITIFQRVFLRIPYKFSLYKSVEPSLRF